MTDLVAQQCKFVANFRLKKSEKFNFSLNLVPIKTILLLPFFLKDPVCKIWLGQLLLIPGLILSGHPTNQPTNDDYWIFSSEWGAKEKETKEQLAKL